MVDDSDTLETENEDSLVGQLLDDRYEIRKSLDRGGMGTVYLAWDRTLERQVVVKIPHARLMADRTFRERFLQEIRDLSTHEHPAILSIIDSGSHVSDEAGGPGDVPYAVVQLRQEDLEGTMYNMVGFQTRLRYGEQKRIFRMIPGLERARFLRLGSMHRNTYINSPAHLMPTLQLKGRPGIFFAGQIIGVEGYIESAAMGILAGINASLLAAGQEPVIPPPTTAFGGLVRYITETSPKSFQPMNVNFGLLPSAGGRMRKAERKAAVVRRALAEMAKWVATVGGINRKSAAVIR